MFGFDETVLIRCRFFCDGNRPWLLRTVCVVCVLRFVFFAGFVIIAVNFWPMCVTGFR